MQTKAHPESKACCGRTEHQVEAGSAALQELMRMVRGSAALISRDKTSQDSHYKHSDLCRQNLKLDINFVLKLAYVAGQGAGRRQKARRSRS